MLSGEIRDDEFDVGKVYYEIHRKRDADESTPKTMRIDYEVHLGDYRSEWVCPEHTGYARKKFEKFWMEHACPGCPIPNTAEEAVAWARTGALAAPKHITVRHVTGERFDRVHKVVYGETPGMTDELMFAIESAPLTTPPGGCPENLDDELPF